MNSFPLSIYHLTTSSLDSSGKVEVPILSNSGSSYPVTAFLHLSQPCKIPLIGIHLVILQYFCFLSNWYFFWKRISGLG